MTFAEVGHNSYPYLWASMSGLIVFALAWMICKQQRQMMIIGAVTHIPVAFQAIPLYAEHWTPRLLSGGAMGIEDFIFAFVTGGTAWLFAMWPVANRIRVDPKAKVFLRRYALVGFFWAVVYLGLLKLAAIGAMCSIVASHLLVLTLLLALRRELIVLCVAGGLTGAPVYVVFLWAFSSVCPDLKSVWHGNRVLPGTVLGVPTDEILGIGSLFLSWPVFLAYVTDVRLGAASLKDQRNDGQAKSRPTWPKA